MEKNQHRPDSLASWFAVYAPPELRDSLVACCATRGKRRGRILASVPSNKGPAIVGCWRSLMSHLAVNRAGIFALIFADAAEREAYDATEKWLDENPAAADVVRLSGGAPLEFSLFHWHQRPEAIARFADVVDIDPDACGLAWYRSEGDKLENTRD